MANQRFGLYRSNATTNLPALSACNDSAENWADARALLCFRVQKSSRTARSRRHGLSFPDREQAIFPGCAVRADLKAALEKAPRARWIIGSNDVAALMRKPMGCLRPQRFAQGHFFQWTRGMRLVKPPVCVTENVQLGCAEPATLGSYRYRPSLSRPEDAARGKHAIGSNPFLHRSASKLKP